MSWATLLRRAVSSVAMLLVWIALWGEPSVGNILSGILVIVGVNLVFPGGPHVADADDGTFRPVAVVRFGLVFGWALVVATWQVVATILRPRVSVEEGIVAVPLRSRSPVVATFVANAISLTPGTLTVEVSEPAADGSLSLYVHALDVGDTDTVRADGRRFESLAVAAFGSARDRDRWKEQTP